MSLSTHVLDVVKGIPAAGVAVRLEVRDAAGEWQAVQTARTDADGRVNEFAALTGPTPARLIFDTAGYLGPDCFFPEVVVTFQVSDGDGHLHVPLLLSTYAYSTYRGS